MTFISHNKSISSNTHFLVHKYYNHSRDGCRGCSEGLPSSGQDDDGYVYLPRPPRSKSEMKPYVTPMKKLICRVKDEKEARKLHHCRLLEDWSMSLAEFVVIESLFSGMCPCSSKSFPCNVSYYYNEQREPMKTDFNFLCQSSNNNSDTRSLPMNTSVQLNCRTSSSRGRSPQRCKSNGCSYLAPLIGALTVSRSMLTKAVETRQEVDCSWLSF